MGPLTGYLLLVLACSTAQGGVAEKCQVMPTRWPPSNLYTCQQRREAAEARAETLQGGRFEFSCQPAPGVV